MNTVKSNLSNKQFDFFETTKKIFMDEINKRTFNYKLLHFVLRLLYIKKVGIKQIIFVVNKNQFYFILKKDKESE